MRKKLLPFITTRDANITDSEIKMLLEFSIQKLGVRVSDDYYSLVINKYHELCSNLEKNYVVGKLDTFLRATCLMLSCDLISKEEKSIRIGVEAAMSWIQKPYRYVGDNFDEVEPMTECDFDVAFLSDSSFIDDRKNIMVDILSFNDGNNNCPITLSENLYIIYSIALQHRYGTINYNTNNKNDNIEYEEVTVKQEDETVLRKIKSFFSRC